MFVVYTTKGGVEIITIPGGKSPNDFIVKYKEPGKRVRTPKHIHLVVDVFSKKTGNPELTNILLDHIIDIIKRIKPSVSFPPSLQFFSLDDVKTFSPLEDFGEYSIEFLLVVTELIMIQEKTNYPEGNLNLNVFEKLRNDADIFSIVSTATFR